MRPFIWFLSLFVLLVVQAGVLEPLHLTPVNLILIMVVVAGFLADFNHGLGLAIAGGLILDFVSGSPDGLVTMSLMSVFLILYFVVNSVFSREMNQMVLFTAVAAATISYFIFFLLFNQMFRMLNLSTNLGLGYLLSHELPLILVFNLLLTYPVLKYYQWVQGLTLKFKPFHV